MINNIKYIFSFILLANMLACQDQTSVYEEFVIVGGRDYPGQVTNLKVFSGHNRVRIRAKKPIDPSVVEIKVYWNFEQESMSIPITATTPNEIQFDILDINEGTYAFKIKSFDREGNISVPLEVFGASYSNNYMNRISNRSLDSALLNNAGDLTLTFGDADLSNGAIESMIVYVDNSDIEQTVLISTSESSIVVPNYKSGAKFLTVFMPDETSIDSFLTEYSVVTGILIDYTDWQVLDFSTEHNSSSNGVNNFIDGTWETRWHSRAGKSTYPHYVTVDMGAVKTVSKFSLARTTYDSPGGDSRGPDVFQIEISLDNVSWISLGEWNFNRNQNGWQDYLIDPVTTARYFRYTALEGPQNNHVMGGVIAYN